MKPVVTRLYAVLVALTFVGLAAWAAADWYQLQQKALVQGRAELRQVAGVISDLSIRPGALDASTLSRLFAQSVGANPRWKMILLSSGQGTEYYHGPRPSVPVTQAVPRWDPRASSEVKVALPVFRTGAPPYILEGIYQFYGRPEIFQLLKACGVTLVVLLVLTTVVVVLSSRPRRSDADEPVSAPVSPEPETAPASPQATFDDESDDEYWFDDTPDMDDLPPLETPSSPPQTAAPPQPVAPPHVPTPAPAWSAPAPAPTPAPVSPPAWSAPAPAAAAPPADTTPSLFAPQTGLGWESFLGTRLDFELNRASGLNQDLALVLLAIKEGSVPPVLWGKTVRESFPSVDLDFEHEGGAAVVLPGRTLEQALQAARAFIETADRTLGGAVVHAGVASRTGRLLSAATLLGEAASAKRRSLSGTVRVLGLKTDPDRYREHLMSASLS